MSQRFVPPTRITRPDPPISASAHPTEPALFASEPSLEFHRMLDQVDDEVSQRVRAGVDLDSAYAAAIPAVIRRLVEGRKTEAFEDRLIEILRTLSRATGGRPVRTTRLATELGQSAWATWYYLTRLEARGLIYRPGGKKSGWLAR